MASVTIDSVKKRFGRNEVLHCIDLAIEDSEFVVLVGPSGCGKSTLLRMIAGLEEVTEGQIKINDQVVNNIPPKKRDIAMVFQNYALYPHMKVFDNMAFSLKLQKMSARKIREQVEKSAEILGLTDYLDRYPRQLSGGQRQRVAMGRAIVRSPKVFLFDEPLSNLDAKLRVQMRTEIKTLHFQLSTTSIYVTHDQIEAMTMADRIVVMHDGWIEQVGTPLELYDFPANRFVAGFIGSPAMNFLEGTIVGDSGACAVELADSTRLPLPDSWTVEHGRRVVYGIRPEHLSLAQENGGIGAKVVVVEPTGSETLIISEIAGMKLHAVFRERHSFRQKDTIFLQPTPSKIHLFDAQTGNVIEGNSI
ncbi:MAG TPA: sn-glycerol-3-phosphate ABC transporter ATP-binding protein UgpC [Desulfobulbaceae bacterium]|nr:sn-glycerol-3-phosphate ABC transporter ATP-binding protein UgpC [Desulfobulbaceae bacterium]